MSDQYSSVKFSNYKLHIFDHESKNTICGTNMWMNTPFHIYKTKFNANDMLHRHRGFAERRSGGNAYKYLCKKCESKLLSICKIDKNGELA